MILPDSHIRERITRQGLVHPYAREAVQPASIDLRLGYDFRVFNSADVPAVDLRDPSTYEHLTTLKGLDMGQTFVLHPGEFVLGRTLEEVRMPDDLVGRVEGKSSLGRLGLIVHATAGFIDPGFHGAVTLEMTNLMRVPIILEPERWICQMSFHLLLEPPDELYQGRYQGDQSVAASRYGH